MTWEDGYELDATITADGYRIREEMPSDYHEYRAYLPKVLTGSLGVKYTLLDKASHDTRFEFDLNQKTVNAFKRRWLKINRVIMSLGVLMRLGQI